MSEGEALAGALLEGLPFAAALGVRLVRASGGEALLSLPYDDKLVGDPATGVLHGGVVTALLDSCAGVAVIAAGEKPVSAATLDLRIDYMRPAEPGRALLARAAVFRDTRSVSFVRADAFHAAQDAREGAEAAPEKIVATAVGAFMIADRGGAS